MPTVKWLFFLKNFQNYLLFYLKYQSCMLPNIFHCYFMITRRRGKFNKQEVISEIPKVDGVGPEEM